LAKEFYNNKIGFHAWGAPGIGKCVEKNTEVSLSSGKTTKIKDIKIGDKIIGVNEEGRLTEGIVTNKFTSEKELYKIKTSNNFILSSGEHFFLTQDGWKMSKDLNTRDVVLYIGIENEMAKTGRRKIKKALCTGNRITRNSKNFRENKQGNNSKTVENSCKKTDEKSEDFRLYSTRVQEEDVKNRSKLFSRDNRWRRNHNNDIIWKKLEESYNETDSYNNKYINGINFMVKEFIITGNNPRHETNQEWSYDTDCNTWNENRIFTEEGGTILNNQEKTITNYKSLYTFQNGTDLWKSIFTGRNEVILGDKKIKLSRYRISKISRTGKTERLYDITTTLGNFIANGILVHNSESIKEVAQDIAKEGGFEFSNKLSDIGDVKKFVLIDIRASQLDPSDIRGLPHFDEDSTKWFIPKWLPRKGQGIIFFDEMNLAPPLVQSSLYELLYDRTLTSCQYELPEGYSVLCAGNRAEDRANVFEMPAPLANRLAHAELMIPTVDEWTTWAIDHDGDERIIAFLQSRPTMIFNFDIKTKDKAFSTPRTLHFTSRMIKNNKNPDEIEKIVATLLGEGTAKEFAGFLKLQRKLNIAEIMKNPESVKEIKPGEIDLKYSLTTILNEQYKKDKKNLETIMTICTYIEPEFAVLTLRFMKQTDPKYLREHMTKTKAWKTIGVKYAEILGVM